jgi:hypothetical protein
MGIETGQARLAASPAHDDRSDEPTGCWWKPSFAAWRVASTGLATGRVSHLTLREGSDQVTLVNGRGEATSSYFTIRKGGIVI